MIILFTGALWHVVETKSALQGAPNELSLYAKEGGWTGTSCAMRLYTLRLGGFVSVSGGELVTKPLTFSGRELHLNFATSAVGSIRVELRRPDGAPIPGFSIADCHEAFGDTVDRAVTWKTGSDVGRQAGKPVRLHFPTERCRSVCVLVRRITRIYSQKEDLMTEESHHRGGDGK